MSNYIWDNISYNESYWAEINLVQQKWKEYIEEYPIESACFQPNPDFKYEITKNGSDIY